MHFVSGLSFNKLEQAFELISLNNTQKIKEGQRLLQTFQGQSDYFTLITAYLADKNNSNNNRLKAVLQLKQFMKSDLTKEILNPQQIMTFSYLFQIYLNSQIKIAKYLLQIMSEYFVFHGDLLFKYLLETIYENDEKKARMFNFMKKWLENEYGAQFMLQNMVDIIKFLIQSLQYAISNNSSELLKFRIVKIYFIVSQCPDFDQLVTKQIKAKFKQFIMYFLNVPDTMSDQKYSMKLKICCMKCLINEFVLSAEKSELVQICKFSGDIWTRYINNPIYTVYCLEYLKTLARLKIYDLLFQDPSQLKQSIQRIFSLVLGFIYNQTKFYQRLRDDPQDFIDTCILSFEHEPIRLEAQKTIKVLFDKYQQIWIQTVRVGINTPPIPNQLMCFVVDSYQHSKQNTQQIQKIGLSIYKQSIRNHFQYLYGKSITLNPKFNIKQLMTFVIQIRLINSFIKRFDASQLKIIAILCCKLANISELVAPVCYNFINHLFYKVKNNKLMQNNYIQQIFILTLQSLMISHQIISSKDILLIGSGLQTIKKLQIHSEKLNIILKKTLNMLMEKLKESKQFNVMNITFTLMQYYMNKIGFEPEFQTLMLFWIKQNLFTQHLIRCYVKYLQSFCSNNLSAQTIFLQMSKKDFWFQNKNNAKLNACLYCTLVKLLPHNSQYRIHVIPNLIQIFSQMITQNITSQQGTKINSAIQLIFIQLLAIIIEFKHQNAFYNMIVGNNNHIFNKQKDNTLLKMIAKTLPNNYIILKDLGFYLLNSKKIKVNDENLDAFFILLFHISKDLILQKQQTQQQKTSLLKIWSLKLRQMIQYISRNNKPNKQSIRQSFAENITTFIRQTKIIIPNLFKQNLQIQLSGLITNSFV